MMTVDPARAEELAETRGWVTNGAGERGCWRRTAPSLGPSLTSIKDMMKTNRYWLEIRADPFSRHPSSFLASVHREDFAAITAGRDIRTCRTLLRPENSAKLLFSPAGNKASDHADFLLSIGFASVLFLPDLR